MTVTDKTGKTADTETTKIRYKTLKTNYPLGMFEFNPQNGALVSCTVDGKPQGKKTCTDMMKELHRAAGVVAEPVVLDPINKGPGK